MNRYEELLCTAISRYTDLPIGHCIDVVRSMRKAMLSDCRFYTKMGYVPRCSEDEYVDIECLNRCIEELYPYIFEDRVPEWLFTSSKSLD